jgi:hypothetical protein
MIAHGSWWWFAGGWCLCSIAAGLVLGPMLKDPPEPEIPDRPDTPDRPDIDSALTSW